MAIHTHTQIHLNKADTVNLGSYYTPQKLVNLAYELLKNNIKEEFENITLLDSSCGYGEFLKYDSLNKKVAADIDEIAIANWQKSPDVYCQYTCCLIILFTIKHIYYHIR